MKQKIVITQLAGTVMLMAAMAPIDSSLAQSSENSGPEESAVSASDSLADIVVTAQRRSENLQKVPIAVTALSADALESAGITDLSQVGVAVPGLNFQSIQGLATPRLRGVGSSASGPGIEPEVAVYVDGVYYASAASSLFSFNNVSQVAVLKGPQGTLFGRNAVGGLVQITTADPTQTATARGEVGYGNYQTAREKLYVAGGIATDLAADLALQATTQGQGYGRNLVTGEDTRRTDHDLAARSKWVFTPDDITKLTFSGDFADAKGSQGSIRLEPGTKPNPLTGPVSGGSPWDIASDVPSFVDVRAYGGSLKINEKLGTIDLLSITALRYLEYANELDLDATATPFQAVLKYQDDQQLSQEFQVQSDTSGPFIWTAGVYYFDLKSSYEPDNFLLYYGGSPPPPNPGFPLVRASTYSTQTARSVAGYAQASYEFLPETKLTLGARYTYEKRTLEGEVVDNFADDRPAITNVHAPIPPLTVDKPTYRASLDHQLRPDVLLYLSYNRGFKSGGFNSGSINDPPYKPETLDAYETGFKSQFLQRRLTVNSSIFFYDYTNIQTQHLSNGSLGIINGASATIKGLDIDAAAALPLGFQLTAGIELLDAKFGSFPNAPISTPAGGTPVVIGNASGNQLPVASKFTGNLGGRYLYDLHGGSALDAAVNIYRNGGWYTEPDNAIRQAAFTELNATLRWTSPDKRYNASLWGDNLTNALSRANATTLAFGNHVVSFNPPRTYGITGGFSF